MYKVSSVCYGNLEVLPDIVNTTIWNDYNVINCSQRIRNIANLYKALVERENYFQFNTPTAFGNPQYNYHCGVVNGILIGCGFEEVVKDGKIYIYKNSKPILVVDKIKRSNDYYSCVVDNNQVLRDLLT